MSRREIAMKSIAIAAALTCVLASLPAKADVVMDWNAKADAIGAEKQLMNSANSRAQAMLHVAMFEAINAIVDLGADSSATTGSDPVV